MGSDTEERKEAAKEVTTIPALYVPPYRLIPLRSLTRREGRPEG